MTNHLARENSPYLLQHADNPVDWYPWGEAALAKARAEDKPIFLSIGYAACHWCHVMAHESFEDRPTAALMNEHFVNIKVDREERPDLDGIYMQAVVAMTGRGGWPMSIFLTPEGMPFYGGTYFPPVRRYNMPSFRELLQTVARLWHADRSQLLQSSEEIKRHLMQQTHRPPEGGHFSPEVLEQATSNLLQLYDWQDGGWGSAPKFPQPMTVEFLLRQSTRGDQKAQEMGVHALRAMARGGTYDVVGGGFARYSTDDRWLVPHFEKMLYDNAQLALAYLHGWLVSGESRFREVCEETLDFIVREMQHPQGGFFSSLDADSEGEEGKFYIWTLAEIQEALVTPQDIALITGAYQITPAGNFEGKNVLQRALSDEALALQFNLPVGAVPGRLRELHQRLLAARSARIRPGTDDKILVAWNALMLASFAEAGRYLARADYLAVAQRNAHFILGNLIKDDRLMRSWRAGQAKHNAYLEDYAALVLGLLALYQTDGNIEWYTTARKLTSEMLTHYTDPGGGFYDTPHDHEALLFRPKEVQDNATPSGSALAACALLQMAAFEGNSNWRSLAESMLDQQAELMARYPTAFAQWLKAADFALGPVMEVVVLGYANDPAMLALRSELWNKYRPRQVSAFSAYPPEPDSPALLLERALVDHKPTVYVCQGFVCQQPVTTPEALKLQLDHPE